MNKQQSYLAIGFSVVFIIQGFRIYDPNISFETVLIEVQEKYKEITKENIDKVIKLGENKAGFPEINRKEIIYFFHAANFDVNKTVDLMVNHYEVRKSLPTIFIPDGKDPEENELKEARKIVSCSILHNDSYATDGLHYIYSQFIDTAAPEKFDLEMILRYFFYMIKCLLIKYGTFNGVVIIINEDGFHYSHFLQLSRYYTLFPHFSKLLHTALPYRLKQIYVLNAGTSVKVLYKSYVACHSSMSTIVFYGKNSQEVYDHVPKKIMPKEYLNGEGSSYKEQAEETYALMKELHHKDEPKRREIPITVG